MLWYRSITTMELLPAESLLRICLSGNEIKIFNSFPRNSSRSRGVTSQFPSGAHIPITKSAASYIQRIVCDDIVGSKHLGLSFERGGSVWAKICKSRFRRILGEDSSVLWINLVLNLSAVFLFKVVGRAGGPNVSLVTQVGAHIPFACGSYNPRPVCRDASNTPRSSFELVSLVTWILGYGRLSLWYVRYLSFVLPYCGTEIRRDHESGLWCIFLTEWVAQVAYFLLQKVYF